MSHSQTLVCTVHEKEWTGKCARIQNRLNHILVKVFGIIMIKESSNIDFFFLSVFFFFVFHKLSYYNKTLKMIFKLLFQSHGNMGYKAWVKWEVSGVCRLRPIYQV